ncbi:MAG TPA: SpoIID/LytB domain-containing protein [Candidatus Fimivivens sp.]|nr:SpoIID/LytB domain-containing protein [Candidatus Fimivivens sp.]
MATVSTFLLSGKPVFASGNYTYENIAFYEPTNPPAYATEGIAFYALPSQLTGSVPVYRFSSSKTGDHFYTVDEGERTAVTNSTTWGYVAEGTAFYAFTTRVDGTVPVYRFSNYLNGDHFYTVSEDEKAAIGNNPQWGYTFEGVAYYVFPYANDQTVSVYRFVNGQTGDHFYTASTEEAKAITTSPVYRFANPRTGDHFYTASESEKSVVANTSVYGYVFEGIAFYSQTEQLAGSVPVYRLVSHTTGDHFYTVSKDERDAILGNESSGYFDEGVAFYAYATQLDGTSPVYRFVNTTTGDHFYTASESEKNVLTLSALGPKIAVGLWVDTKSDLQDTPLKVSANKRYNVKDKNGAVISTVDAGTDTRVGYDSSGKLKVYGSIADTVVKTSVSFDSADGYDGDLIMYVNRPGSSYDHYRGTMKVQYTDNSNIWIINTLPMEQYVWGMGETTGTGDLEHTKVMTDLFRTYGYWYAKYATKYNQYGFTIRGDSGSQVYYGYDWETKYPNIRAAAEATRGIIATYGGDVALTPYSSWSDGRTRSFKEVWGSSDYPWCQSVSDPYGKHPTMTTAQLKAAGNHMVGLIAHGSLDRAGAGWSHIKIMKYYYAGIGLDVAY